MTEETSMQQPGYLGWNDAVAAFFFNPERAGQNVYLYVTDDVLEQIGRPVGAGPESFLATLQEGPPGLDTWGHCQRALHVASGWRDRGYKWPPYLAYLALFVLAAGHEGDFDPRSYYPRLWELLGQPDTGTPASFHRMLDLWDDLERWAVHDRQGELGIFEARIVGERIHIGLPLAQTIFTEAERRTFPAIFTASRLEPGTLPSGRELLRALRLHGRYSLLPRTNRALAHASDGFLGAVLDVASDEFLRWDGAAADPDRAPGATMQVGAGLRFCMTIDRIAGRAAVSIRCRATRELPADGLSVAVAETEQRLTCRSYTPDWSSPLAAGDDAPLVGTAFVPAAPVWRDGLTLNDAAAGWTLRLREAQIRIFVDGSDYQLPGLIEILELPRNRPFYIAFHRAQAPKLEPWLGADCHGWEAIQLISGFPDDWAFGYVGGAASDAIPRSIDVALGFRDRRSLRLSGGIRASAGNIYFDFAPPRIILDGAEEGDQLVCAGITMPRPDGSASYLLPGELPLDSRIGLEVRNGDEVVKRTSLYLVSGGPWRVAEPLVTLDQYGHPIDGGVIAGANAPEPEDGFVPDPLRTPGLSPRAERVYFLGRAPGQIAVWPADGVPEWPVIWAVPLGRRGTALYCGGSLEASGPIGTPAGNRRQIKLWRQILWRRRARIATPKERALKTLWLEYRDAARK